MEGIKENKIVITGAGVVSACGLGMNDHLKAFREGSTHVTELTQVDLPSSPCEIGFEVILDLKNFLDRRTIRTQDRPTYFGILAVEECLQTIKIDSVEEIGLITGSNLGGIRSGAKMNREILDHGPKFVTPLNFQNSLVNSPTYQVGITHQLRNLYFCISTGLCSGSDSIGFGYYYLKSHPGEILMAGSMEDINSYIYSGFLAANFLLLTNESEDFRPLDKDRKGTLLGEGAAFFAMQSEKKARENDATVLAEISGYGTLYTSGIRKVDIQQGMERSMQMALDSCGMEPEAIDLVISSANGNRVYDRIEAKAVTTIFNTHMDNLLLTAPKSLYGECVSLGGPMGVLTAIFALNHNFISPTRNFKESDPDFRLNIVKDPLEKEINSVMVNTFSSHGHQSSLILKKSV